MIFLGIIVATVAVGAGVGVVLDNTGDAQLTFLDHSVPGVTSTWHVFLFGAVVAVVFMSGMIVSVYGLGRSARARRELRHLRDEHEESLTTLEMEKRHLERELARARQQPGGRAAPQQQPGGPGAKVGSSSFFDSAG
jgi:hypothetical protein